MEHWKEPLMVAHLAFPMVARSASPQWADVSEMQSDLALLVPVRALQMAGQSAATSPSQWGFSKVLRWGHVWAWLKVWLLVTG